MEQQDVISRFAYPAEQKLGTHLTALPIGPDELLVTWQLSSDHGSRRRKAGSDEDPVFLRIHDVSDVEFQGDNSVRQWTYELEGDRFETVVKLDRPGLNVCAELVPDRRGGTSLARTRPVLMPRQDVAGDSGMKRWMIFERS